MPPGLTLASSGTRRPSASPPPFSPAAARAGQEADQRQRHPDDGAAADELAAADVPGAVLVDDVVLELAPLRSNSVDLSLNLVLAHAPTPLAALGSPVIAGGATRVNACAQPTVRRALLDTGAAAVPMHAPSMAQPSLSPSGRSRRERALHRRIAGATAPAAWRSRDPATGATVGEVVAAAADEARDGRRGRARRVPGVVGAVAGRARGPAAARARAGARARRRARAAR